MQWVFVAVLGGLGYWGYKWLQEQKVAATIRPPSNFNMVRTGLFRGGHPDLGQMTFLKNLGIKTIVDLEVDDLIEATPDEIADEIANASKMGLTLIRAPMSAFEPAIANSFDKMIDSLMKNFTDPGLSPIYVHCRHGQDRTGLVIGLERVIVENWKPEDAYSEMVSIGFHPMFLGLKDYFQRKTGWTAP
jgi:protein tyrosine/serine phosphatase